MTTKNSSSQNNIDASCVNSAKQIIRQQELLNQRIEFWTSIYDDSRALFARLLSTNDRHVYIVPEGIHESEVDRNEVHLLRQLILPVKEFIAYKINSLEQKSDLIQKIIDD